MVGLVLGTMQFLCISVAFPNVFLWYLIWGFLVNHVAFMP